MSWWDRGNDVLGDEPADRVIGAWRRLLARRAERGESAPTTREALDAFAAAVTAHGIALQLVRSRAGQRIDAFDGSAPAADVQAAIAEELPAIDKAYQRQTGRAPRASELARTLAFVLRADPGVYLSDPDDWTNVDLAPA